MNETGDSSLLELLKQGDEVPEGWFTTTQWAEKWNLGESQTRVYLRKAIAQGKMERQKFRVKFDTLVTPVWHYRPLPSDSSKCPQQS